MSEEKQIVNSGRSAVRLAPAAVTLFYLFLRDKSLQHHIYNISTNLYLSTAFLRLPHTIHMPSVLLLCLIEKKKMFSQQKITEMNSRGPLNLLFT